ncbi:MAG: dihydroorotate dehydrogenase (quinone), partial [Proteobacteria bacterium]|nr:dihydroorotate dehydrogenase (quinone) [Pseudomonadota bacterium]
MYSLIRKFLFLFDAETVHVFSLNMLSFFSAAGLLKIFLKKRVNSPRTVMGIEFPNAVGLAAGLDKNAVHIDALSECGFGFIEVGTVTPVAQPGNDRPRLFRLPHDRAIINRMGFNNDGVETLVENVKHSRRSCVLGINIGKNKDTPLERAVDDYLLCMKQVYEFSDYITINISSPNTPGLRDLQHGEGLSRLLLALKQEQTRLNDIHKRYVPLVVKIAPDLDNDEIND